jgi:hypothetical protein
MPLIFSITRRRQARRDARDAPRRDAAATPSRRERVYAGARGAMHASARLPAARQQHALPLRYMALIAARDAAR